MAGHCADAVAKKRKTGRTGWGIFERIGGGHAKTAPVPPWWHQVQAGMNTSNSVDINGIKIRLLREQKELTQLYLATVVRLLVSKGVLKPEEVETIVNAIELR